MLNNPKIIRAWSLYDWSNSVYSLVISSTIFPIFYSSITTEENSVIRKKIELLGFNFERDKKWPIKKIAYLLFYLQLLIL